MASWWWWACTVCCTCAGITPAPAAYGLWAAALVIQVIGPALGRLDHRFDIRPAHFVERHGALMIVAFGESVADVGIGAEGHPVTFSLALSAALGLALSASLWWAFFGIAATAAGLRYAIGHPGATLTAGPVLALAAWPLSVAVDAAAGIALLTAVTAGAVALERRAGRATVEA